MGRYKPIRICHRCGRQGHITTGCYARFHVNGEYIASSDRLLEEILCFKCGRLGHTIDTCNGKTRRILCYECGKIGHNSGLCSTRSRKTVVHSDAS